MGVSARGFLEDARRLQERIRSASERIEQADAILGLGGVSMGRDRVSGSSRATDLSESVQRLQDYRAELAGLLDDYVELQRFADGVIARLPDARHRQVLSMRYLEGREPRQIARAMRYSESNVRRLRREALAALDDALAEGRGEG